jgi:hypothetical protein
MAAPHHIEVSELLEQDLQGSPDLLCGRWSPRSRTR